MTDVLEVACCAVVVASLTGFATLVLAAAEDTATLLLVRNSLRGLAGSRLEVPRQKERASRLAMCCDKIRSIVAFLAMLT